MDVKFNYENKENKNDLHKTECATQSEPGQFNKRFKGQKVFEEDQNIEPEMNVAQVKQELDRDGEQDNGPNICQGVTEGFELKQESTDHKKNEDIEELYNDHEIKEEMALGPVVLLQSTSLQTGCNEPVFENYKSRQILGMFSETNGEQAGDEPMTQPSKARKVDKSSGGLLHVGGSVEGVDTPRRSARQRFPVKDALQQSVRVAAWALELEMVVDEEEEAAAENNLNQIQIRFDESQAPELVESVPYSLSTPVSPWVDVVAGSGIICDQSVPQYASSHIPNTNNHEVVSASASGYVDVSPSLSGMVQTSRRTAQIDNEGSEFDSDSDDEFDIDAFTSSVGTTRDIPDDEELNEPVRKVVNSISTAMDDAIDRLVSVSTDFTWQDNFDTFEGVPEEFSGPNPGPVTDYDTPYEAFTAIWSKDFIEYIVRETNRYARQVIDEKTAARTLTGSSRLQRWTDTDVDEMFLFFAIYIFMGIDPRTCQYEYWRTTGYLEMPKFRQLMTYNRFILLNKFIHFAKNPDPSQNSSQSEGVVYSAKLAKIAPVLEHLNEVFSKLYNLQQDIAIDESLTLYKGRLSWAQSIRTKVARFGIKSFELCESKTGYLWKFEIYTGKNSERDDAVAPSIDLANKSTQVVLDLLRGLENRGHFVTMDNFYNCPALARHLKSLGFDCLGTLRLNRKHVPVEVAKVPKDVPKGTIIARHSGDVTCIAWKDSKIVNMISTYHTDETYVDRKAGRNLVKPIAVRDYNNTMGGVDLKDQKLAMYLMERKRCLKWYMKIFKRLLNVSVHNAFIMLMESLRRRGKPLMTHRNFREQLANSLADRHGRLPQAIRVTGLEDLRLRRDLLHVPELTKTRSSCHICARNDIRRFVHLKCDTCDEFMCAGNCWSIWHTYQQLPGRNVIARKNRRRR